MIGQRLAGEVHIVLLGDFVILIEAIYGHVLGNVAQQNVRLRQGSSFLSINDILGNARKDSRLRGQEGYLVYAFHTQLSGSRPGLELEMVYKELVIVRKTFGGMFLNKYLIFLLFTRQLQNDNTKAWDDTRKQYKYNYKDKTLT